jgi:hypothetical protein
MDKPLMVGRRAEHEERSPSKGSGRLLIVVPPSLPSRVQYFTVLLAGSGIDVVIDRRLQDRRLNSGRRTNDRRRQDRRGQHQVFGYFQGCSVVVQARRRTTSQLEANRAAT